MLIAQDKIPLRRLTAFALGVAACAISSTAFAAQNLILAFGNSAPVPIGGWTTIAIALMLAASAVVLTRRKGESRYAQWSLLIVAGSALSLLPATPEVDAGVVINQLVTSPLTLSGVTCSFPSSTLTFQNATGGPTTIQSVTLSGAGGCSISPPAVSPTLAAPLPTPQCTAGLQLANSANCTVTLFNIT